MRIEYSRWCLLCVVAVSVWNTTGIAGADQQERPAVMMRAAGAIRSEHERQLRLRHELDVTLRQLDHILEDIRSNRLLEETDSHRFQRAITLLQSIGSENVDEAAAYLNAAFRALPEPAEHLTSARAQIQSAADRLTLLLQEVITSAAVEDIYREIKQMLARQEELHHLSRETAGKHYSQGTDTTMEARMLSNEQGVIERHATRLDMTVREALDSVGQPHQKAIFAHVRQAMGEYRLVEHLTKAAADLANRNYLTALQHQEDAMRAMQAMLAPPAASHTEALLAFRRRLFEILSQQEVLTASTTFAAEKEFRENASRLSQRQLNIRQQLLEAADEPFASETEKIAMFADEQKVIAGQIEEYSRTGRNLRELHDSQDVLMLKVNEAGLMSSHGIIRRTLQLAAYEMQEILLSLADNNAGLAAEPMRQALEALAEAAELADTGLEDSYSLNAIRSLREPIDTVAGLMQQAADSIRHNDRATATYSQSKAEEVLREIISELDDILRDLLMELQETSWSEHMEMLYALARQIDAMIARQQNLKEQVEALEGEAGSGHLSMPQRALSLQCLALTEDAIEMVQKPLAEASALMDSAAKMLHEDDKANAVSEQEQVLEILKKASADLHEHIAELEAQWEEIQEIYAILAFALEILQRVITLEREQQHLHRETGRIVRWDRQLKAAAPPQQQLSVKTSTLADYAKDNPAAIELRAAYPFMDEAFGSLEAEQANQALAAQEEALKKLSDAREAAEAYIRQLCEELGIEFIIVDMWVSAPEPEELEPHSEPPGLALMEELIFSEDDPPVEASISDEGERLFVKGTAGDDTSGDPHSTWHSLAEREREAVTQNFSGELPVEYRAILKAYFEALARE